MTKYIYILFLLIASSIIYMELAKKFKIVDKPNYRSSHTKPTIRGGGILFFLALLFYFLFVRFSYPHFFTGLFILALISFLDDLITLSSRLRFLVQLIAILLLMYEIAVPVFPLWFFGLMLFLALTSLNIFNFMDGINGITGLNAMASMAGLFAINTEVQIFNPDIFIYVALAILVFGFYNFRKNALMFAGDIGSITIGFFIIFIAAKMIIELDAPLIILVYGIYGVDSGGTIVYRKFFTEEKWTEPHRHHIYQKLVDIKGWSHLSVSVLYFILQLFISLLLYYFYDLPSQTQWLLSIPIGFSAILFYLFLFNKLKCE